MNGVQFCVVHIFSTSSWVFADIVASAWKIKLILFFVNLSVLCLSVFCFWILFSFCCIFFLFWNQPFLKFINLESSIHKWKKRVTKTKVEFDKIWTRHPMPIYTPKILNPYKKRQNTNPQHLYVRTFCSEERESNVHARCFGPAHSQTLAQIDSASYYFL